MSVAVVTGAARGIGRAIAERLAADGYTPLLVDLADSVRDAVPEGGAAVVADVSTEEGWGAIRAAAESLGPVGVLVNNAGITRDARLGKMTEEDFRAVLRVNLGSAHGLTAALADLIEDGGAVVNISSRAQLGNFGQFNYAVSKAGVIGLTRSLALLHAPRLRVNAVAPGFVASEMTDAMPAHVRERVIAAIPLARAGLPADIAAAVAWLASPDAGYVTGQVLYSCGGRSFA
ncbi:MAG: SDR family oxidoreductase [Actinobacteria bacterium]|nr:SDR family oxidoreductase [Actinomycetota bacterium]